jgi:hypothetical protein
MGLVKTKNYVFFYLIFVIISSFSCSLLNAEIIIIENGRANCSIVIADSCPEVVKYASSELQYHINKSTGVNLEINSESSVDKKFASHIYLGQCATADKAGVNAKSLKPNGFIIKSIGKDLYICGDDASGEVLRDLTKNQTTRYGTLFGVYEFLEQQLHVKWLWPGKSGEFIPKHKKVIIGDIDQKIESKLLHTRLRVFSPTSPGWSSLGWSSQEAYNNFFEEESKWLKRHRIARPISLEYGHGFTDYWDRYHEKHPEYFNLLPDGTRGVDPYYGNGRYAARTDLVCMNVSEPGLWKQIVENWLATKTDYWPWINCSENDTNGKCMCSLCMAWDVFDPDCNDWVNRAANATNAFNMHQNAWETHLGSLSDRYAKFALAVQAEARKIDANAVVIAYAYANYLMPPIKTKLNENIVIGIVPSLMFPWTESKRQGFRDQWDGWTKKAGARAYLRPNYSEDGHNLPIFFADKFVEDFSYAYRNGMVATDFSGVTGQWAAQSLNLYALGIMHRHGDWTVSQVFDDYMEAFGPAKQQVRQYWDYWKKVSDSIDDDEYKKVGANYENILQKGHGWFSPEVLAKARRIIEAAQEAASGDESAKTKVDFLEKGLRHAELTLAADSAFADIKNSGSKDKYFKAVKELDDFRASVERDCIADMTWLYRYENRVWKTRTEQSKEIQSKQTDSPML